jgi:hypothetical protein
MLPLRRMVRFDPKKDFAFRHYRLHSIRHPLPDRPDRFLALLHLLVILDLV